MKSKTCFIVEDDLVSAQYLKEILEEEGIVVTGIVDNAEAALEALRGCPVDLVLMDIILRGALSGSEAAVILTQRYPRCRVLFLTAYADEEMIEYALDARAAAYLMKPYREKEILATVRMILEQKHVEATGHAAQVPLAGGFVYDLEKHLLRQGETIIPLSNKKRLLIETLVLNRGGVVSNEQLCMAIWGEIRSDGTLRSLISRLKEKVGKELITNVNGMGYTVSVASQPF